MGRQACARQLTRIKSPPLAVSRPAVVLIVAVCVVLGAATPTTASPRGLKVLVTGNCAQSDLANAMKGMPGIASATAFDVGTGNPTAAQFAAADIVVDTGDYCDHGYIDAVTYGNRLADYLDHGGVVLQVGYDNWDSGTAYPKGRFKSGGYPALALGPNPNTPTQLGEVLKPKSPILHDLGKFVTNYNTTNALASGATLLAKWADGRNAVAVKGRVVTTSAAADDLSDVQALIQLTVNAGVYFHAVPTTRITKATVGASTATFRFKAVGVSTGFQCELKKAGTKAKFKPCPSHKTYSNLKPGSYTFEVAAVGPGGADPTPAKKSFTLVG
jgi:hypothetical protein